MRTRWVWSIAFFVAACGEVKGTSTGDGGPQSCTAGENVSCDGDELVVCSANGMSTEHQSCAFGCNPDVPACRCEVNTSTCTNNKETRCDANGVSTQRTCTLGCFDATRCSDIAPSNLLAQFLDDAETGAVMELKHNSAINTVDGTITIDGIPTTPPSVLMEPPPSGGGVKVRVFAVKSLKVTGEIFVTGFPALAIVSDGDIEIMGIVRARSGAGPDGNAMGGGGTAPCGTGMQSIGGQGGGGYGGVGGAGGTTSAPATSAGAGGLMVGNAEIVPLRGGGNSAGIQFGGGAIQLVSRSSIVISSGGAIDAGGGGGANGGGGGGAGGGILLEAPVVTLSGVTSALAANGGGGGCYGTVTQPAERGRMDTQRALGCVSDHGDGGLGGAGTIAAGQTGGTISGCAVVGGAGGGSVGRIRINTPNMTFTPMNGAIVSPPPSIGLLGTR